MPWVDLRDMLNHAYRNHYAVGSFSVTSLDCIEAVVAVAERIRSPVVLSLADNIPGQNDFKLLATAAECAAQRAAVPVALHFERNNTLESAVHAINRGCNGVQIAAAHESFTANVAHTRRLAEMAHACGVMVEGVLGRNGSEADDPASAQAGEASYTTVEEARAFVQRTQVDCLMVSIGTGSGRVRGRLKLDIDRLRRINDALHLPLAMRAENGFADEQCHKLLQHGIARVSFANLHEIAEAGSASAKTRGGFSALRSEWRTAMQTEVEHCLQRLGSAGRAAEVLVQCRPWRPVKHVIVYNVEGADDAQVETMMARGRETLGRIPGVRSVFTGWSVADGARYRCCWLVEFVHEKVIDSYRQHPEHVFFANQLFRPIAGDRISIDFIESGQAMHPRVASGAERVRA